MLKMICTKINLALISLYTMQLENEIMFQQHSNDKTRITTSL